MQKLKMFRRWLPDDQFLAICSFQDFQKIAGNKGLKIKVPGGGQIKKRPSLLEGEGEEAAAQSASYFFYYIPMHFTKGKATHSAPNIPIFKGSIAWCRY